MDFMKEQFLQSISREDVSMQSGTSSQGLEEHLDPKLDENEFAVLAGKSQDPIDNDPNFGDFWDSLTSLISEKISQDKDRKRKGKEE